MRSRVHLWTALAWTLLVATALVAAAGEEEIPSESQCRPYIEKALKELESGDVEPDSTEKNDSEVSTHETNDDNSAEDGTETTVDSREDDGPSVEVADEPYIPHASVEDLEVTDDNDSTESAEKADSQREGSKEEQDSKEDGDSKEDEDSKEDGDSKQDDGDSKEETASAEDDTDAQDGAEDQVATETDGSESKEDNDSKEEAPQESAEDNSQEDTEAKASDNDTNEDDGSQEKAESDDKDSKEEADSKEETDSKEDGESEESPASDKAKDDKDSAENVDSEEKTEDEQESEEKTGDKSDQDESGEQTAEADNDDKSGEDADTKEDDNDTKEDDKDTKEDDNDTKEDDSATKEDSVEADESSQEEAPEEELLLTPEIPANLRSRDHITQILRLDEEASEAELVVERSADIILRDLKRTYENSIKPLEALYKYRDLSNRHFGDPEIFSKPLVLFMGPWSGGKSSILNYLTGIEFTDWALRTGAEPSPAYFNLLMHGSEPTVLDGTQLAAHWTFSGLQKFGQGLEERLRGLQYPSKILEKVNIVEIPGILEVRKQVSRVFPFNDACQWFIDRADIIFLVYDPSKLDVGPETEAILDQLKGREAQTRIVLNKADTVKPEELMRVQSALIWNISPLMSSAQPPALYTVSLWSLPYEAGAPARLLQAQERELLRDLRHAIDRRIENKIASARRFAVRVRNHAKMVDCYLTTYYNHKTIFGNRKLIADAITDNPQHYHIYEGLSTLTNISRYDLPDPESYRDFFRLNPLYEFQQLTATCTYFRGCPLTKLDVAIAYDLPELVGKYKKMVETATPQGMPKT